MSHNIKSKLKSCFVWNVKVMRKCLYALVCWLLDHVLRFYSGIELCQNKDQASLLQPLGRRNRKQKIPTQLNRSCPCSKQNFS